MKLIPIRGLVMSADLHALHRLHRTVTRCAKVTQKIA
jgi:hypothetical protein